MVNIIHIIIVWILKKLGRWGMNKIVKHLRNKIGIALLDIADNKIDGAKITEGLEDFINERAGTKLSSHFRKTLLVNTLLEMGAGAYGKDRYEWADRLELEVNKIRNAK